MDERLEQELTLLRKYFEDTAIDDKFRWIKIPNYNLPTGIGWNRETIDVCLEVKPGFPGASPYGIYVPSDLRFNGLEPKDWQSSANNCPSFPGKWGMLSWTPVDPWLPGSDITTGSNLLNFVLSFKDRFLAGQ